MILSDSQNSPYKPIVSVVVAVKNGEATIRNCIDSFANQTLIHKEIIIMDGGSDDGTVDIIRSHTDTIAYWESKPDRGIAHAWNKALPYTKGEWIIFLGADDRFYNSIVLEQFVDRITSGGMDKTRIIYGKLRMVLPGGNLLCTYGEDWPKAKRKFFSEKMTIPHPACFHHRTVFRDAGFFDESFSIAIDYEFLLRVLKKEEAFFISDLTVTNMAFSGLSSRVTTLFVIQNEVDRALRKNGFHIRKLKRTVNIVVYRLLSPLEKRCGEHPVKIILDAIRVLTGKHPVWTRK